MRIKFKNNKGFTLAEMVVSMAIMALIATMSFAAIGGFGSDRKLKLNALALGADLAEMKSKAMAGKKIDDVLPSGYCIAIKVAEPNAYYLYADLNANYNKDLTDKDIKKITLSGGLKFINLTIDTSACFKTNDRNGALCVETGVCAEKNRERYFMLQASSNNKTKLVSVGLDNGVINVGGAACPPPYKIYREDIKACPWSCSAGTTPDNALDECVCQSGLRETGFDQFGRRICEL